MARQASRASATAQGQLTCVVGPNVGRVWAVTAGTTLIGRAPNVDIVVASDDVSRHHAKIELEDGRFVLEDLGSRNGTRVNGVAISRQALATGDRIELGTGTLFRFVIRDEMDARVERFQRLQAMGELTAGLAHDFRNLLTVIVGCAYRLEHFAKTRYAADVELGEDVRDLSNAANEAVSLAARLMEFGRRDVTEDRSTAFALGPVVLDVMKLLRRSIPTSVTVVVEVDDALQVLGSRTEIQQVLTNLCLNARDAMPAGGELAIRASPLTLSLQEARELQLDREGDFVDVRVVDTGVGMDAATLARVFEPFFTTKAPGSGFGLGLASVYGLVRSRGGNVLVESTPGAGSTFRVILRAPPADVPRPLRPMH